VFTGQTVSNEGGPQATAAQTLTVAPAPTASTPTPVAILSALHVPRHVSFAGRRVGHRCVKTSARNHGRSSCRRPFVLHIGYTVSAASTVTFRLAHRTAGRRVKRRCVALTAKDRGAPHCTRSVRVPGQFTRTVGAGVHRARISRRELKPGTYQLTATPAGGTPHTTTFRIS
jgi:hypothetical protein